MRSDLSVQCRLRKSGLVRFVVTVAPIANEVDQEILLELCAILDRKTRNPNACICMLGIHVNDRNFKPFCQVARISRRSAIAWISRESDLVVYNDVKRSTNPKSAQPRHDERLGHDSFARKRRITVDAHRYDGCFVPGVAVREEILSSARNTL
jgi:hypothetical protein